MEEVTKEKLRNIVFVEAHNRGELTDDVKCGIDRFEIATYRSYLQHALEKREAADRTGDPGGGVTSASELQEALQNLAHILAK